MRNLLTSPILWALGRLHEVVHDWALAIALLAVLVSVLLWALSLLTGPDPRLARAAIQAKIDELLGRPGADRAQSRAAIQDLLRADSAASFPRRRLLDPPIALLGAILRGWVALGLLLVLLSPGALHGAAALWGLDVTMPEPRLALVCLALFAVLQTLSTRSAGLVGWIGCLIAAGLCVYLPVGQILYWMVRGIIRRADSRMHERRLGRPVEV